MDMRAIRFGIEIETIKRTREQTAAAIHSVVGGTIRHVGYPASYDLPNIISVAASDENDQLAWFSNYGATTVDVAAPGGPVLGPSPTGAGLVDLHVSSSNAMPIVLPTASGAS